MEINKTRHDISCLNQIRKDTIAEDVRLRGDKGAILIPDLVMSAVHNCINSISIYHIQWHLVSASRAGIVYQI